MKKCEILAPVGGEDMLIAAVRCGADAVYLGAKDFSARRNAENFGLAELESAIKYCHIRGVKVYLTLNILIKEKELTAAFDLARDAYNLGIDGIIIEDLGLARILREKIPELQLHASTQMSVHSASALPVLKEMGFTRVVVAREISKTDLRLICEKAKELNMEIEVFVHGALCMCLSGQCQLSAFLGERSGNRGLCAGPCRLPFKAENGTGYDLSLKDLSLLDNLTELKDMGVVSFKIEGRMKRPEYVAAAVTAARQSLDKGFIDKEIAETLRNIFSRQGFTDGYYTNALGKNMFGIRTKEDVVSANKAFPVLHELYRVERKSVPVSIKSKITENNPISLTLNDGENTVTVEGEIPQKAKNKPTLYEDVLKNITKLGGTPYYDEGGSVKLDDGLFVSASGLNDLRRKAVEKLDILRSDIKREKSTAEYKSSAYVSAKKQPKVICRFSALSQIPEDLSGVDGVIYPIYCNPTLAPKHHNLIVEIPRGLFNEKKITELLGSFKQWGFKSAMCGNLAAVEIAKQLGFDIIADTGLNIFNSESAFKAEEIGLKAITLSYELSLEESGFNSTLPKGIIAYGNVPLMTFKNCPLKNGKSCADCDKKGLLTDRMGIEFPVSCQFGDKGLGYSELLNSVPIWLADRQKELSHLDFITLYFTRESKKRAEAVINAYKQSLSPDVKYTRGLYFRGVI